jgi:metallo-beta-lactamase family protein
MRIQFLGAAGTVTGSKYLLESSRGTKILIDCGLFQGIKDLRLRNWKEFPVAIESITAIVLSHAHIDHSGYIPRLVQKGFNKSIYCTPATKALAEILLEDSAYIKEEEAAYANYKHFSKHHPALPLYTKQDVAQSLPLFKQINFNQDFEIQDFKVRFLPAGHILGASSILIQCDNKKVLFSGDLGRNNDLLMKAPTIPPDCDYLILEGTYGDRLHEKTNPILALEKHITQIKQNKSILLIPSFAVGRSQLLLYCIYEVFKRNPLLRMPVFINSPMANEVTDLYKKFNDEHKLNEETIVDFLKTALFIKSIEESKQLNKLHGPMIIIAASGMLAGGRILHHLNAFGSDPKNIILLVGFQAPGTRGANLMRGEKQIKFHGYYHEINAQVLNMDFFSAHADQEELISWVKQLNPAPKQIIITHAEPDAAHILKQKIESELQINTRIAKDLETLIFS